MAERMITLECAYCKKKFDRPHKQWKYQSRIGGDNYRPYCSKDCAGKHKFNQIEIDCTQCHKKVFKTQKDFREAKNHFCSYSCSAVFNNQKRIDDGFTMKGMVKEAKCAACNKPIVISAGAQAAISACDDCRVKTHSPAGNKIQHTQCKSCQRSISGIDKRYCDDCRAKRWEEIGSKGGKASAAKQVRRSLNEVYFADLCIAEFSNVATNDGYFVSKYGNWDADVILHEFKLAILWNGIWHYKQVRKNHKLKQVQARDKIKHDVIIANGYVPYIIKDMGKHDKAFVEKEFKKLKRFIAKKMY